jgi:hypothetical protein
MPELCKSLHATGEPARPGSDYCQHHTPPHAPSEAAEMIESLRSLLQAWEPRVRCPQCGQRYSGSACGPAHAIAWHLVQGGTDG